MARTVEFTGQQNTDEFGNPIEASDTGAGKQSFRDKSLRILNDIRLISEASGDKKEQMLAEYANDDQWLNQLGYLAQTSNAADRASLDQLTATITAYRDPALPKFRPDIVSEAAKAKADPAAIKAQHDLLTKIMGQTDPNATAIERFEAEKYRQAEEQSNRAAREAVLSNMRARGIAGGGAELGATLDSQSENARSRMLSDLGLQAQAQERALGMIGMGANLAGDIRQQSFGEEFQTGTAADTVGMFNNQQDSQNKRWIREQLVADEKAKVDRGATLFGAQKGVTESEYGRGEDAITARSNKERDIFGAKIGLEDSRTAAAVQGKRDEFGYLEERRAEELSKPKFSIFDPSTWGI